MEQETGMAHRESHLQRFENHPESQPLRDLVLDPELAANRTPLREPKSLHPACLEQMPVCSQKF